jgi:stage II sporulation protein D
MKIFVLLLLFALLAGCNNKNEDTAAAEGNGSYIHSFETLDSIPVTRASAAKMAALTFLNPSEINSLDYIITFPDVDRAEPSSKYINAAVHLGFMNGDTEGFRPDCDLTVYEAQIIINNIDPENRTTMQITEDNRNLAVSCALWHQLFLKSLAGKHLSETPVIIMATSYNSSLPPGCVMTDKGAYFADINLDAYIDKGITAHTRGNRIIAVGDNIDNAPIIENAYIVNQTEASITVFAGGVQKTYDLNGDISPSKIADVKIENAEATVINALTGQKTGAVKKISHEYIEFHDGKINRLDNIKVYYEGANGLRVKNFEDILPGMSGVSFYLRADTLAAAVMKEEELRNIRVLIGNSGFMSAAHQEVTLASGGGLNVFAGGMHKKYGESVTFNTESDELKNGRVFVSAENNGRIKLESILRNGIAPEYRGIIELSLENGAIEIINELPFEEYLYGVVSCHISIADLETAKAQAVASRSSAVNQIMANRYASYGANVDDSIRSQLYLYHPETEQSVKAVTETEGQALLYNNQIIKPQFFLASGGYTADSGEVWASEGVFPSQTLPYLKSAMQFKGEDFGDITKEDAALHFFKQSGFDAIEQNSPWLRWHVRMSRGEIEASAGINIPRQFTASPHLVKTFEDGEYIEKEIPSIGAITDVRVGKRGAGGIIMELVIVSDTGQYHILTENNIRRVLRPYQYTEGNEPVFLTLSDGTRIPNHDIMPSAFFAFEIERDETGLLYIDFYGGGNGHGAGMSQYGAMALADGGADYKTILKHFFSEAVLGEIRIPLRT